MGFLRCFFVALPLAQFIRNCSLEFNSERIGIIKKTLTKEDCPQLAAGSLQLALLIWTTK
jgi:hypothetical protein